MLSTRNWLPVGGARVVAECEASVHDQRIVGQGAVHSYQIGIVFDTGTSALGVIVAGVTVM